MTGAFSDATYVGDLFRVACAVLGIVILALIVRLAREVRNTRQYGMYSLAFFSVAAIGTEIERIGDLVTWRLPVNVAGVVLAVVFLEKTRRNKRDGADGEQHT